MSQAPKCLSWGQRPAGLWPGDAQLIRGWGGIHIITPVHRCCCTDHPSRHIFPAVLLCSWKTRNQKTNKQKHCLPVPRCTAMDSFWNGQSGKRQLGQYSTHRDVLGSSHNHRVHSCDTFPSKHCWFSDRTQEDYAFCFPLEAAWLPQRHLSITLSDIPDSRNQAI